MSNAPINTPPPREQTASVPVDRPCDACGYNLRGQTAAWDRQAQRWRCTCPECGATQAVNVAGADGSDAGNPYVRLIISGAGLYAVWLLLGWVAASEATLVSPDLQMRYTAATNGGRSNLSVAGGSGGALPDLLTTFFFHVVTYSVRLVLAAAALGALIAVTPYGRPVQRLSLALALVGGACLMGIWMGLVGYMAGPVDYTTQVMLLAALRANNNGVTAANLGEWQWRLTGGVSGVLIAFLAVRVGLALGRPIARQLASMFLPAEARPTFRDP